MSTAETRPLTSAMSLAAILMIIVALWYGTRSYEGAGMMTVETIFEPQEASAKPTSYKTLFGRIPVELPTPEYVASLNTADRAALHAEVLARVTSLPPWVVSDPAPEDAETPPEIVASGVFESADELHEGGGRVSLLRLSDGSAMLRLEDFRVVNGPNLQVLVSWAASPGEGAADEAAALPLGRLKGNVGNQNYTLPPNTAFEDLRSVVVYCALFGDTYLSAKLL